VDAINGDIHAAGVLHGDAGLGDDVRHAMPGSTPRFYDVASARLQASRGSSTDAPALRQVLTFEAPMAETRPTPEMISIAQFVHSPSFAQPTGRSTPAADDPTVSLGCLDLDSERFHTHSRHVTQSTGPKSYAWYRGNERAKAPQFWPVRASAQRPIAAPATARRGTPPANGILGSPRGGTRMSRESQHTSRAWWPLFGLAAVALGHTALMAQFAPAR
jgi:hypothetical protein